MSYTFLTFNARGVLDGRPCFSPDGETVLFMRTQDGVTSFYTVPTDGGEATEFFAFPSEKSLQATRPDWSWVSGTIALTACPAGDDPADKGVGYLYTIDGEGRDPRWIQLATEPEQMIFYPSWYPDGETLAVTNYRNHTVERVTTTPEGTEVTPITDPSEIWVGMCSINPNPETGWLLAGAAQRPSAGGYHQGHNTIWLQAASGSLEHDAHTAVGRAPWWSPDGRRIAFEGTDDPGREGYAIYVQTIWPPDGNVIVEPRPVTPFPELKAQHAKWSPTVENRLVCMAAMDTPDGPRNGIVRVDF